MYEKDFYNNRHEFSLGYNTEELSNAKLGFTTGENFDSEFYLLSGSARIKLFQNLSLSYSTQLLNFNPDPENRSTFINIVSTNYNFNKDLWIKAFVQNSRTNNWIKPFVQNSRTNNKAYLYGMFGWRFKPPFGALYLIYSHDQFHMEEEFVRMDNFFVKLTYPVFNY